VIGARATRQAILGGLLDPTAKLKAAEAAGRGHEKLALMELGERSDQFFDDVRAMRQALAALGYRVEWDQTFQVTVHGAGATLPHATAAVNAAEAGTVGRFALALAACGRHHRHHWLVAAHGQDRRVEADADRLRRQRNRQGRSRRDRTLNVSCRRSHESLDQNQGIRATGRSWQFSGERRASPSSR